MREADLLTSCCLSVPERTTAARAFALLALFILPLTAVVQAQPIKIHPRVGEQLEQNERDYFNLFRQWPAGAVRLTGAEGDSVRFVHADSAHLHLTVRDSALIALGEYLDRFENADQVRETVNFSHLRGIAGFRRRFRPRRTPTFMALSEESVTRTFLFSTGERLVVLDGDEPYDWREVDARVQTVGPDPLGQIIQPRPVWITAPRGLFALGVSVLPVLAAQRDISLGDGVDLVGAAALPYVAIRWALAPRLTRIDGGRSAFERASRGMESKSAFPDGPVAPELTIPIGDRSAFPAGAEKRAAWEPGMRFGISSRYMFPFSSQEAFAATGFGLIDLEPRYLPWIEVTLDRDRSRRISYGAAATLGINVSSDEPALEYSGQMLTVHADMHRNRPEFRRFGSRWSVAAGAGVTVAHLTSVTDVEWSNIITNLAPELDGTSRIGQSVWTGALQLRATAFYRLDASSLARIQLTGWVPPLALSEKNRNVGSNTIYGFDRIGFPVGLSIGVVHEIDR